MAAASEPRQRKVINGYGDGGFRIAGERVEGSVIVFPQRFMGCGSGAPVFDAALRDLLREHRISVDAMDTGAACRTYNILLTESRAIAAALIAV
jgi:uncharacterized protein